MVREPAPQLRGKAEVMGQVLYTAAAVLMLRAVGAVRSPHMIASWLARSVGVLKLCAASSVVPVLDVLPLTMYAFLLLDQVTALHCTGAAVSCTKYGFPLIVLV